MKLARFLPLVATAVFLLTASCESPPESGSSEGGSSKSSSAPEESEAAAAEATGPAVGEITSAPETTAEKTVKESATGNDAAKDESKPKSPAPADKVVEVNIRGLKYLPGPITVSPGTTVRWINEDRATHTATSEDSVGPPRSEELKEGESYEHTFRRPGQYDYYCMVHPFMKSGVTVE